MSGIIKLTLLPVLLLVVKLSFAQSPLDIKPEFPERGQDVTITYHAGASGAKIPAGVNEVSLVFTYSTFYELPYKLPLKRDGDNWSATFKLQRYATFATFYVQSGSLTDKPATDQHYAIKVYNKEKRVLNSYLHESYSLSAQMGRSPLIRDKQRELLLTELKNYPDNYEAKIRLITNSIAATKDAAEKKKLYNEAHQIIAKKFAKAPTTMGNLNQVTMGYLILGESSRVDSVHKVVLTKYPTSDAAMDFLSATMGKEKDSAKIALEYELALKTAKDKKGDGAVSLHRDLFGYYASKKNVAKALYHARYFRDDKSPHRAETLKEIAETLTKYHLAPDTALKYATQAFELADQYPVGVIRYFPEFGYIPGYVADSIRYKKAQTVRSNLFATMAVNYLTKKDSLSAIKYIDKAWIISDDKQMLLDRGYVCEHTKKTQSAFNAYWQILLKEPTDSLALAAAERNYKAYNGSLDGYQAKLDQLTAILKKQMRAEVKKQVLNLAGPELTGITDLQGKPVSSEQLKGKIVVMDFWATWCIPCMEELPYLQKVYNAYKNNPKVMFMVINSGARNTLIDAQGWAKTHSNYTFPLYFNNDKDIGDKVGFTLIPTIAVLDASGKMQFRTVGFEGMILERKLNAEIDLLLETM